MSVISLLTVALTEESDLVLARQRARQIAELLGFEKQDQTRISTAVSEIARNATSYGGGGRVNFALDDAIPAMRVEVRDKGRGIADLPAILEGRYRSAEGMGVGITGTRRMMDEFTIDTEMGAGTTVRFARHFPRSLATPDAGRMRDIVAALAASAAVDPATEIRLQNQELMESLAEIEAKRIEAERLNAELAETNRGVVALYAELDEKARQLAQLNGDLEARVAEAVAECQSINDALRQSQKMEAVGQLTGGIAHDFNNLLQIVIGNLERVQRGLPDGSDRIRRGVDNAMAGARRAATLTQRLLAFSRRQPLDPQPTDPNLLIEGMIDLIARTLGEAVTVKSALDQGIWPIEVDFNQLENAVLNLAVNARDAMGPGGTLTISTANGVIGEADADDDAVPGHYVSVAICDTGAGMTEATMARAFEPFFTTKEVGKGTGLGLSMVYGFVKQSGGHMRIESGIGRGTTVTLYLPRYIGELNVAVGPGDEAGGPPRAANGETILLVEDDDGVRSYSTDVLTELGYAVIEAVDGSSAIEILTSAARIDLVFTDVILAGTVTARDVADAASSARGNLPVLFTTGYARDAIVHNHRLDPGVELLSKPFTGDQLGKRIAKLLSRSAAAAS